MSRERNPRPTNSAPAPRGARWLTLASGDHVLVDAGLYPMLVRYAWSWSGGREGSRYARTCVDGSNLYLHRLVTAAPVNKTVDHVNGDKTDCRLRNLDVVSHAENCRRHAERKRKAKAKPQPKFVSFGFSWTNPHYSEPK